MNKTEKKKANMSKSIQERKSSNRVAMIEDIALVIETKIRLYEMGKMFFKAKS